MTTEINYDEIKMSLNAQRIDEFISSLINDEDPNLTKENLSCLTSKAIVQIHKLEQEFLLHLLQDTADDICPCCVASYTRDVVNAEGLADAFNRYLGNDGASND